MHLIFTKCRESHLSARMCKAPDYFLTSYKYVIMKVFILAICLTLSGLLQARELKGQDLNKVYVSLQLKNSDLKAAFKKIEALTAYRFTYKSEDVAKYRNLNYAADKLSLEKVLHDLLKSTDLGFEQVDNAIIIKKFTQTTVDNNSRPPSQDLPHGLALPVKGKVTDANGSPLPGATIKIKNGKTLATTNTNGEFEIANVADSTVLQVSFIGYQTKEIMVTNVSYLNISLDKNSNQLNEVAVISTGYQTIPKERATGSFEQVSNEQINRKTGTDILSRLDGYTTILFDKRNSTANLQIRGLSTLTQGISQPLIILDNFPYQGDINDINPNDVADITLLKDAAAASIWGARAGNGVIVINTKKASFNKPVQVSFNSNISITGKPNLFDIPILSSSDFIDLEVQLFNKGAFDNKISDTYGYPALTPVQNILNNRRLGIISSLDSASQINALRKNDVRKDFLKYPVPVPV